MGPISSISNGVPVKNAGLVIAGNYVPMLFERFGITHDRAFKSVKAQERGVQFLQYVATGSTVANDNLLALNKVLCGLPPIHKLTGNVEITKDQQSFIDGLIEATISQWQAIGNSSVNGFKGNWLIRDGMLTRFDERWELKVETRAYDVLLHTSPFSFSIIKYPWMEKALHVNWPY